MKKNHSIEKSLEKILPRLSEMFASANINFLFGSGISKPYLPTLNNIEKDIKGANTDEKKAEKYKEYFEKVMLPNINIALNDFTIEKDINDAKTNKDKAEKYEECFEWKDNKWELQKNPKDNCKKVYEDYQNFLMTLAQLILDRKTTVVGKQVNIFTTNIDIFFERALEDLELHYNDGFLGKMNPVFDLSNFKQSTIQRSHHYDNRSEIPVFNLLKIHGSVNWKYKESEKEDPNRKIYLSSDLSHFDKTALLAKTGTEFITEYKNKILVVNPEDAKFSETVLNKYYYELLRSYSSELERENSVLFVIGFSMADQHIQEITKRAARSNPTLQIYIFVHSKEGESEAGDRVDNKVEMEKLMEVNKNHNIKIIAPEYAEESDQYNFNLQTVTNEVFQKITLVKKSDLKLLTEEVQKISSNPEAVE